MYSNLIFDYWKVEISIWRTKVAIMSWIEIKVCSGTKSAVDVEDLNSKFCETPLSILN